MPTRKPVAPLERGHARADRLHILGRTLNELRTAKQLTCEQLMAKSGVHHSSISRIENAKDGAPTIDTLSKLAAALDVPVCRLFDQSHSIPSPLHLDPEIHEVITRFRQLSAGARNEARRFLAFLGDRPAA